MGCHTTTLLVAALDMNGIRTTSTRSRARYDYGEQECACTQRRFVSR
jgi:hypothetical protein